MMVLVAVIALAVGLVGGFFLARNSMKSYLQKNPPISEEMMKSMMMSMGQKPSQKKLNQMMAQMKQQQQKSNLFYYPLIYQMK
ncbi:YneF family protein [Leuconostoc fallax]|uniref:YneF family protein n=1 Tax=Leuconostoc fallax TaxID=1251 RepID=UPI00358F85AB